VAPFHEDPEAAIRQAIDRVTGQPVKRRDLQTYVEALAGYHLSPESKFRNGQAFDVGRTERRHIRATGVTLIGKEADQLEEAVFGVTDDDLAIRYGGTPSEADDLKAQLVEYARDFGDSAVSRATGISRASVAKLRAGGVIPAHYNGQRVRIDLMQLDQLRKRRASDAVALKAAVNALGGIRPAARALGLDPSNLSKRLRR
jgi:hypothetical protein